MRPPGAGIEASATPTHVPAAPPTAIAAAVTVPALRSRDFPAFAMVLLARKNRPHRRVCRQRTCLELVRRAEGLPPAGHYCSDETTHGKGRARVTWALGVARRGGFVPFVLIVGLGLGACSQSNSQGGKKPTV